jgi:hypothetical protein
MRPMRIGRIGVTLCEALESRRLMSAALMGPMVAAADTDPPPGDVVLEWNDVAIQTLRMDRARRGPTQAARSMAMVQIAVFDTVNAITRSAEPILADVRASRRTPLDAAVASAAHDTLLYLYPQQKAALDADLATTLERVPNGGERRAVKLGSKVAREVIAARAGDGGDVIDNDTFVFIDPTTNNAPTIDIVAPPVEITPGKWRPDPLNPTQKELGVTWGMTEPFAIDSPQQFTPPHPPALDSPEYAAAYNEVKTIGAKNSAVRTAEQTEIGLFWAYDRIYMGSPLALYNQVMHTLAVQEGNTLEENARLFAVANVAMADSALCSWDCKNVEDFWRPITAIRYGDLDDNALTDPDPAWKPLGAPGGGIVFDFTPPFPAYVSGHATFGAAVFRVLEHFYGTDAKTFTLTSDELPGVTRTFNSFSQAAEENGISRIYLGIHWSFDNVEGQKMGRAIADEVFQKVATPRA